MKIYWANFAQPTIISTDGSQHDWGVGWHIRPLNEHKNLHHDSERGIHTRAPTIMKQTSTNTI